MSWWEDTLANVGDFAKQRGQDALGMLFSTTALGRAGGGPVAETSRQVFGRPDATDRAFENQMSEIDRLGGRQTLQQLIGQQMQPQPMQATAQPVNQLGMTAEEMLEFIFEGSGGGGVDLSGYNALLDDIASREAALGGRRDENLAGIQSLYESAAAAREEDQAALEASIEAQIQSDMERQAAQEASRRAAEAERFETASEARQALGADVGTSDVVGQTVEQSIGRLAERALAGQQDIGTTGELARQQLQAEKSGYTSAQELATRALTNAYEDRLAQLASERAATQAQIAQARASARGGGPSISDKINAMGFISDLYGGGEQEEVQLPGVAGVLQQFGLGDDPTALELGANIASLANAVYRVQPETGKLLNPLQLAAEIVNANPQYTGYDYVIAQLLQNTGA